MADFDKSIYTPFTKVEAAEDGTAKVYGLVSSPVLDLDQQITDAAWFKSAVESDYRYWLNVREMHQPIAAGHGIDIEYDGDSTYMTAIIDDLSTAKKCISGTLKGFSYGLKRPVIDRSPAALTKAPNGIIKGGTIVEVSVVDRPANPEATITLVKMGEEELQKRDVSESERADLADEGKALPDGSFPIANKSDLANAVQAYGRAKDKAAAKAHIIRRAKALGATDLLPANWTASTKEKTAEADVTKGEPNPEAISVAILQQASEWDDSQLWAVIANLIRYAGLRHLHESYEPGEQYYLQTLGMLYDIAMQLSQSEAMESWENMADRIVSALVTGHTLTDIVNDAAAEMSQQQPENPNMKWLSAALNKAGAEYAASNKNMLGKILTAAITMAGKQRDILEAGHAQMKASMPDICKEMAPEGDDMDKAAIIQIVEDYLRGEPELIKAANATEGLRSDVEALKAEVAEMGRRVQPVGVWQGGAQPRPEPNSERALYKRLAQSENPAIQRGAEKWLEEHP